jgi:hypothetical protein
VTLQDFLLSLITSATASLGLTALAIWLSREWISARIKADIQYQYDQKLETHRAQLKAEQDVALIHLQTAVEKEMSVRAAAHASFSEGQKAAMERKLNAADKLWKAVISFRNQIPATFTFIDVLSLEEYKKLKSDPRAKALIERPSTEKLMPIMTSQQGELVETVRPYVGEYTWAIYFSYHTVLLRLLFLSHEAMNDQGLIEWYKDDGTRALIASVLSASELKEFDALEAGRLAWLKQRLELKLLAAFRRIISGEEFGAESLQQAIQIQQRATELQSRSANALSKSAP